MVRGFSNRQKKVKSFIKALKTSNKKALSRAFTFVDLDD